MTVYFFSKKNTEAKQNNVSEAEAAFKFPFLQSAVANHPYFEKRYKGGEDSWLISTDSKLVATCDGVGGWNNKDICPGLFSKQLTKTLGILYDQKGSSASLKELLLESSLANPNKGSSTAVLARLKEDNKLDTCNLGDSGYLWCRFYRKNGDSYLLKELYESEAQQHRFNCPY